MPKVIIVTSTKGIGELILDIIKCCKCYVTIHELAFLQ
jgi:hypothetical protein